MPTARKQIAAPADQAAPIEPEEEATTAASMAGGIRVDGGPAIAAAGEAPPPPDPDTVEVLGPPEPIAAPTVEETVWLLRAVWGVAHHATRLTGGPDDAFQPSAQELRDQAAPLAQIAGGYPWLAYVIRKSPYFAAAVAVGGYAGTELERVGDHRSGRAGAPATSPAAPGQTPPSAPPPPPSAVRSQPQAVDTEYGLGLRDAPRPGPAPRVA